MMANLSYWKWITRYACVQQAIEWHCEKEIKLKNTQWWFNSFKWVEKDCFLCKHYNNNNASKNDFIRILFSLSFHVLFNWCFGVFGLPLKSRCLTIRNSIWIWHRPIHLAKQFGNRNTIWPPTILVRAKWMLLLYIIWPIDFPTPRIRSSESKWKIVYYFSIFLSIESILICEPNTLFGCTFVLNSNL